MHVQIYVGSVQTHLRAAIVAMAVTEPVDYGILYAIGHKTRVGELLAESHRVERECLFGRKQGRPIEIPDAFV